MTIRINVDDVRLVFDDVVALDGLSLTVEGNKIIGLIGRNGSGKTSLLSLLAAFRKPTSGEIRVNGEPVFENAEQTSKIAFIRESGDTVEGRQKVTEALRVAAQMRPNWDADYAQQLIDRFEIPTGAKIDGLSRGKRSALGIVLGMAARAPITIFDETYLGMDAPSRYAFYDEILNDFIEHPRMFIVSTHLIEEVSRIFEEVVIIDEGRLLVHDDVDSLLGQGVAITGPEETVDQFVGGRTLIGERQLGRTKSVMLYGQFDAAERERARGAGLDLDPIALQDLFVHLTTQKGGR